MGALVSHPICITYGCMYELDLDGQVTCVICGGRDDDMLTGTNDIP